MLPTAVSFAALVIALLNLILGRKWPSQQLSANVPTEDWRKPAQLCSDIADAARILMVISAVIWVLTAVLLVAFNAVADDAAILISQAPTPMTTAAPAPAGTSAASPFAPVDQSTQNELKHKLQESIPLYRGISAFVATSIHIAFLASVLSMIMLEWAISKWTTRYP
jgi:hypothetical protein